MTEIGRPPRTTQPPPSRTGDTTGASSTSGASGASPGTPASPHRADGLDRSPTSGRHVATDRSGTTSGGGMSTLGLLGANRTTATTDATPPVEVAVGSDSRGPLYLSPQGFFVDQAGKAAPDNVLQQGDALFRAAQLSEAGNALFSDPTMTMEQKQAAFTNLAQTLNNAHPDRADASGYQDKDQALQARASAAPLLLDLATSLDPSRPEQAQLRTAVRQRYFELLNNEPHGVVRNFMIYDLNRVKDTLGARDLTDRLMNEVAPLTPPYDEWFKGDDKTLKVDYHVGAGFWEEEVGVYVSRGFERTNNSDGTITLTKTYTHEETLGDGTTKRIETPVEMTMHNGSSGLFKEMDDPSVDIVVYSGHANYGRQVPSHLGAGADGQQGAKVFMGLQCGGKGTHNAILEKYPDLHMIQSKNSSYGSQDRQTVLNTLEGISKRQPWATISRNNQSDNSSNYYFPSDTLINKRAEDRDADGKVDDFDRVVNYNPFKPVVDLQRHLTPIDPGKPADELEGRALHGAVLRFHRMAGYNSWARELRDQGVLNDGFYDGAATDPLLKVEPFRDLDGQQHYRVQVNKHYSHASEAMLGAAMHYELGRRIAAEKGESAADAKGVGLIMAAKAIDVDTDYGNDRAVWKALLGYAGLPEDLPHSAATHAIHVSETYPAGNQTALRGFMEELHEAGIEL